MAKQKLIVKEPNVLPKHARLRKKPKYKSFRLHKRIKHPSPPLPSWWQLLKKAVSLLEVNKRAILVFLLVYGLLNLLLVRGFQSPVDIEGLREAFSDLFGDASSNWAISFTAFGLLLEASTQTSSDVAEVYQLLLLIIASLAVIWLFRQQQAGNQVTMKMAFYRGMYPLIPFTLVLMVIGLQMLPAVVGNFLFTTVNETGLAINAVEQLLWVLLFLSLILLSLYFISSSLIALYIVTLPEMTPLAALKKARELVRFRRFAVLIRVVILIFISLILLFALVLPVIFFAPALAEWLFFAATVLLIPLVHGYMFSLYRELL